MENNDMLGTLKGLLGENADEKIGMVMDALKKDTSAPVNVDEDITVNDNDSSQYLSQIKNIIGQMSSANDSRSNLLMSLRPFMRKNRQKSIDNVIKILNLSKYSGLFK